MNNVNIPQAKVKNDKYIWLGLFVCLFILLCLFLYFIVLWPQALLREFPYSSFVARRTGYSESIDTSIKVLQVISPLQGGFIVTRSINQDREVTSGWRTFPDGGINFLISMKKDISMVKDSGEIVWRKTYAEYPVNQYNSRQLPTESDSKNSVLYPKVLDGGANVIRSCPDGKVQLAYLQENWVSTGPGSSSLHGYGDFVGPGVEINLNSGEMTQFTDAGRLCTKEIRDLYRPQTDTIYACGDKIPFVRKMGDRSHPSTGPIAVLKEYYQFPCNYSSSGYQNLKADPTKATIPPGPSDILDIPL